MTATRGDPRTRAREQIIAAAARLLRDGGAGAVTTRAVAHAAQVRPPTIYRHFGDKDGPVRAVAEHVMATYVATKPAAGPGHPDPVQDLRDGWAQHLKFGLANPGLYGLLRHESGDAASPSVVAGLEVLRTRVHRLAAAGRLRVAEERAVMLIHAAGTGAVLALLESPADHRDVGLADAMLEVVLQGIITDSVPTPSHGPTTVTVSFAAVVAGLPGLTQAERGLMDEWVDRALSTMQTEP